MAISCKSVLDPQFLSLNSNPTMKIMVIEDHPLFREMISAVCRHDFGWLVVAETGSGIEAVQLAKRLLPELVILDLHLPDIGGFEVVKALRAIIPRIRILIVTSSCDDYTVHQIERLNVNGFLDKNSTTGDGLKKALSVVAEGRPFFSHLFQDTRVARFADQDHFAARLTEWEQAILTLIGEALTDEEIGTKLGISPKTVMTHRSRIMKKLNVSGTPKLIRYALDHGFTHIEPRNASNRGAS